MADSAEKPRTVDAFFARKERQPERHELVVGTPLRMTVGLRNMHDDVVVDVVAEPRRGAPVARDLRRRGLPAAAPPPKAARRRLERFPTKRHHLVEKDALQLKDLGIAFPLGPMRSERAML